VKPPIGFHAARAAEHADAQPAVPREIFSFAVRMKIGDAMPAWESAADVLDALGVVVVERARGAGCSEHDALAADEACATCASARSARDAVASTRAERRPLRKKAAWLCIQPRVPDTLRDAGAGVAGEQRQSSSGASWRGLVGLRAASCSATPCARAAQQRLRRGHENVAADSQAASRRRSSSHRKLKDFPWNGWLRVGVLAAARGVEIRSAASPTPPPALVWSAVGDDALLLDPTARASFRTARGRQR